MEQYEVELLITNLQNKNKESWEQTRLLAYITAQINSTKKMKPTDIIKFPWDNATNIKNTMIDEAEKQALFNRVKQYEKKLNNGK